MKDERRSERLSAFLQTKAGDASGEYCIVDPDTLAVAVVRGVHVSPQQKDYYDEQPESNATGETVIGVQAKPLPVLSTVNIKAHVKGLK